MHNRNIAPLRPTETKNRELSWFAQMVERGREAPFTEIVTVTPAIAERLLERNDCNRKTSEAQIAAITKDITSGYWQLNGETIIVSREGFLNDGQNRLNAVIRAGEPIRTAMMFGVSRDSRMSVDMGRQRRASDFMAMNGVTNSTRIAAIVNLYELYRAGVYSDSSATMPLTKQDILHAYEKRDKAFNRAHEVATTNKQIASFGVAPVGAAYMILRDANPVEAEVFFARLADGTNLSRGSAILAIRNRLGNSAERRLRANQKLELILRGWNAWRDGRSREKTPPISGSYPKVSR